MQNKRNINSFGITLNRYCMLHHVLGEGGGYYMLHQVLWERRRGEGTICYNRYSGEEEGKVLWGGGYCMLHIVQQL